jgi:hypothetical protein
MILLWDSLIELVTINLTAIMTASRTHTTCPRRNLLKPPLPKGGCSFPTLLEYHHNCSLSRAPVAHAFNPSYSGESNQEDHGLKPARENSLQDPIWEKNLSQKNAGGMAQGYRP